MRAAAARVRCFCSGEAWLARRVVMMPHAEESLMTHRGGSEPEQATCRMTGRPEKRIFSEQELKSRTADTLPAPVQKKG